MAGTACVIGAGMSGLAATKCLIDAGLEVTCYERDRFVGGRWNNENTNPIPRSTVTNLPSYMSCFSDFPMKKGTPLYFSANIYAEYFQDYAENFCLLPHINFEHKVLKVEFMNCPKNGWKVKFKNNEGDENTKLFDFMVISSGFYVLPYIPEKIASAIKGFTGNIVHSKDFKDAEGFRDKNVVVSGLGNTGGDISVESSKFSKSTCLSTSRGSYIISRIINNGTIPISASLNRLSAYTPSWLMKLIKENIIQKWSNHAGDMERWNLKPKNTLSVIINDELPYRVAFGKVKIRKEIIKTEGRSVYFNDGQVQEDVDTIVLCTGYTREYPFLDETILKPQRKGKFLPLYKGMFPVQHNECLAFVGMFSIFNSVAIGVEMQSRFIAERFKRNIKLPTEEEMAKEIQSHLQMFDDQFKGEAKELNLIMDPWAYYNELADQIGCRPSILQIMFSDPILFWHLWSRYSFHEFRLYGPNKWNGARDAIINSDELRYSFFKPS
ncbi:dimethylaniline monooxygenase [N-oxide-forming] 2-like [Clytia hemisphaerica]|uniref:Flavin-containing monooxygenase n=1 Tax=Clytia hemisphaerica TaxID=252671 RepID=A0A7M5WTZ3_9CNID